MQTNCGTVLSGLENNSLIQIITALFADALDEGLSEEQAGQSVLDKCEVSFLPLISSQTRETLPLQTMEACILLNAMTV